MIARGGPCSPGCCLASSHDGRLQQSAGTAALKSSVGAMPNDLLHGDGSKPYPPGEHQNSW